MRATNVKSTAQLDLFYAKVVDEFSGGGGASSGMEMALGRPVDAAVNHDPAAIRMHKTNHPHTLHYQESVWAVDPKEVAGGHPIGLAWFSPTCTHFSRAKGLPLVDRHIRGLAWVILRWADDVRPWCIMMENVPEFVTWGPLMPDPKGRGMVPDPAHKGETFHAFIQMLTTGCKVRNDAFMEACEELQIDPFGPKAKRLLDGMGYDVEFREMMAADYGAATSRKRFFLIARSDGKPIVWPEPTHAPRDSKAVKEGKKLPYKSAAEIIDWTIPCPSIFDDKETIMQKYGKRTQRPLRPNTMRRIARGLDKFVLKSANPFIIPRGYGEREGQLPRVHDINDPVPTIVATNKHAVVVPNLVNICHAGAFRGQSVETPLPTLLGKNSHGLVESQLIPWSCTNTSNSTGEACDKPLNTVRTGGGGGQMLMQAQVAPWAFPNTTGAVGAPADQPVHTITSVGNQVLAAAHMIQYHTEQPGENVRGQSVHDPVATIDTSNRHGLVAVSLNQYFKSDPHGADVQKPLGTILSHDHHSLQASYLSKYYGGVVGAKVEDPLPTITAIDHNAMVTVHIEKMPETMNRENLGHWPEVRELLNEFCGYTLADNDILLLKINGQDYYIEDIGLRMLTPRELYNAMGFPADYIIDRDYKGNAYKPADQIARCGNAVPPPFATALVKANFPEWCTRSVTTMRELEEQIAV